MIMDAIIGAWVIALGGEGVIGIIVAIPFIFMIGFVFYKITT